jgi:hypothetical protein
MSTIDTTARIAELQKLIDDGAIRWTALSFKDNCVGVECAQGYHGTTAGWSITVVRFERDGQVGYDGAAASLREFSLIHLTPGLAQVMVEQAVARTEKQHAPEK